MVIVFAMGVISCVKDVDLNQAGDISLQPEMQVDLVITNVDEIDFMDTNTNQLKRVIRDTVRLEFLDDDYIQDDLVRVEFSFRYINTFPQTFNSKIFFLSENNRQQHLVDFYIGTGSEEDPAISENIEFIGEDRINVVKRSIKMVVEIEVLPNSQPFNGSLDFASKGLFSFEF